MSRSSSSSHLGRYDMCTAVHARSDSVHTSDKAGSACDATWTVNIRDDNHSIPSPNDNIDDSCRIRIYTASTVVNYHARGLRALTSLSRDNSGLMCCRSLHRRSRYKPETASVPQPTPCVQCARACADLASSHKHNTIINQHGMHYDQTKQTGTLSHILIT